MFGTFRTINPAVWLLPLITTLFGCGEAPSPSKDGCKPGEVALADGTCARTGLPGNLACPPGELWHEDRGCQPAGLPLDLPCQPGELFEGGVCKPAGVSPEGCAAGFMPDGDRGCEPILPSTTCSEGEMAIPGESTCREIVPCGDGPWGDIPLENTAQYVDQAYAGNDSDGSAVRPWKTIQQAINTTVPGGMIAIAAGTYEGNLVIGWKPIRIWGRCPSLVQIVGEPIMGTPTITMIGAAASGSELRNIGISGPTIALAATETEDILLDGIWAHDNEQGGIAIDFGSSAMIVNTLVEKTTRYGVLTNGAKMTMEDSVIRDVLNYSGAEFGVGVQIQNELTPHARSNVTVRRSVIERIQMHGINACSSDVVVEASVLRTKFFDSLTPYKSGIDVAMYEEKVPEPRPTLIVRSSVIEQNLGFGMRLFAADAVIEDTVIRNTKALSSGDAGNAIESLPLVNGGTLHRSNVTVRRTLLDNNRNAGIFFERSDAVLEGVAIRNTLAAPKGNIDTALQIQYGWGQGKASDVTVRGCLVDGVDGIGIGIVNSQASIEGTLVRGARPTPRRSGLGIGLIKFTNMDIPVNATINTSIIEDNVGFGFAVEAATANIEHSIIRRTQPTENGTSGRGILARNSVSLTESANLNLRGCLVEQNHESGMALFSSNATVEGSIVRGTQPSPAGYSGMGIAALVTEDTTIPSNLIVLTSIIEDNHQGGVIVGESTASIESSIVRNTKPEPSGAYGDGILAYYGSAVDVRDSDIMHNGRAGIASFGSSMLVSTSRIACNPFDLEGEVFDGLPFSFDGSYGWWCTMRGANDCSALDACAVQSAGITAPPPLEFIDPL